MSCRGETYDPIPNILGELFIANRFLAEHFKTHITEITSLLRSVFALEAEKVSAASSVTELDTIEREGLQTIERYRARLAQYKADLDEFNTNEIVEMLTDGKVPEEKAKAVVEERAAAYLKPYEDCLRKYDPETLTEQFRSRVEEQRKFLVGGAGDVNDWDELDES